MFLRIALLGEPCVFLKRPNRKASRMPGRDERSEHIHHIVVCDDLYDFIVVLRPNMFISSFEFQHMYGGYPLCCYQTEFFEGTFSTWCGTT